ncbi:HupE/UreJ family protein [uncultured Tateyamaria sp.]|uniref:HupE/UreJ family protein n=1 Tax=uncultured Tateyamaria sp. TaxID=455651 RepID=UPI0026370160|nr:HupE/UreJ family protein [uncultured Tateyamaria sp.]
MSFGLAASLATATSAHGVATQDQGFLASASGINIGPFLYLGAKHMVTGYDHLLVLAGVIFFQRRLRDSVTFVSLFPIGHSITLLFGVLSGLYINTSLIDAVTGLSVRYKALENPETFRLINPKSAFFRFGLVHELGLSSKLQDLTLLPDGLIINMLVFNVGVEIEQVIALIVLVVGLMWLRQRLDFIRIATGANVALLAAGLVLFGMQSVGNFAT